MEFRVFRSHFASINVNSERGFVQVTAICDGDPLCQETHGGILFAGIIPTKPGGGPVDLRKPECRITAYPPHTTILRRTMSFESEALDACFTSLRNLAIQDGQTCIDAFP